MKTIVIPQFYRGPSGQKGLYNRQEVGLARAFAALGCRAVVLYPEPGAKAPRIETPEPNVKICYMPAVAFGVQAFYKSWQILLDEHADAVHVMGDNSLGVPGLYRFCQKHGILFYSQLGALKSTSNHAAVRRVMDLLLRRNLAVYRKTPTYAKTPAVAAELESLGVPCAGLMPAGPYMATYYATKAYVVSLTSALAEELREMHSPVYVGCLCPGPVNTEFNAVANVQFALKGITPEFCVRCALHGIHRRKTVIVPGPLVAAGMTLGRFLPRSAYIKIAAHQQQKKLYR